MTALFTLLEAIKKELNDNKLINQVTFGNLMEVELEKTNIYPLAHVGIQTGSIGSATSTIEVSILFLDIVDDNKEITTDKFYGNDNEEYVMNEMFSAATKTAQELLRGTLFSNGFEVYDEIETEFFTERFKDKLAGCGITMNVTLQNNLDLC